MKRILLIAWIAAFYTLPALAQVPLKSKAKVTGVYITSFSKFLDTLKVHYGLNIVYDPHMVKNFDVVENYYHEPIKNVLSEICKNNDLHYWVDRDQTVFIIVDVDDVKRLRQHRDSVINAADAAAQKPLSLSIERVTEAAAPPPKVAVKTNLRLTGRVIDQLSGESLPAALIKVVDSKVSTSTNADGYFTLLNVPADTCRLEITYTGYQAQVLKLDAASAAESLQIGMLSATKALKEVTIRDKKGESVMNYDKRRVSVLEVTPAKLEELPSIGERDILRSFQLMPGISGSNESSSGAYVRGGTPDQNLVLFDGFTVYQVDHLYGFFSAFNSNTVKDVTMYKGGFSAKYGGRLSSVTDIVGKDGNRKETEIGGDLSLLSANIYMQKPLNDNSSLLVAYRHSYQGPLYDKIFAKFNSSSVTSAGGGGPSGGRPGGGPPGGGGGGFGQTVTTPTSYFYDFNSKYTYELNRRNIISWSIYQGNDNLDNSRDITLPSFISSGGGSISTKDQTTYGNFGSSVKWSDKVSPQLYVNTLLSYSTYHSDRDNSNTNTTTNSTTGVTTTTHQGTYEHNKLEDWSLKSDAEYQYTSATKLLFGAFATHQNIVYNYTQNDTTKLVDQNTSAITGGLYAELEESPGNKLQFKPGIRATYYGGTGQLYYEPRFSATYTLTDKITLKASTGRFYQFANRVIREDILSGSRDFWVLANRTAIPVGVSYHYIAGASYETNNYLFDVEMYYKTLGGLTEYSERETGDPRRSALTLEQHFYNGTGNTSGIEFLLQKTAGNYTGWISYTLAQATNNFEVFGGAFPANQDTRHEFKTVHVYHHKRWTFSSTWIFATGHPYTMPLTSYTIVDYSGTAHNYLTVSGTNTQRMPNYHRLDASVTYDLIKIDSRKIGSIGFSLFNIYNRANVWYKQYTIVNNQVIATDVDYLGFTPNITLSIRWK